MRFVCYTMLYRLIWVSRQDIWSDLQDQTKFWTDLEDQTERLSSLEQELSYRKQIVCQLRTHVDGTYRPKYYTVTLKCR